MDPKLIGAIVGAVLSALIAFGMNASPYPPFKGWWFVGMVAWGAVCGALAML